MRRDDDGVTRRQLIVGVIAFGYFILALGWLGRNDLADQEAIEARVATRSAQLQAACLPGASGDTALIRWNHRNELVCVVQSARGEVRAQVLRGNTWTPL